ncbi:Haus Augmin-Like Complex Subunit 3 [Manis pentadactyla]|nr:Haus Augmin-Like Complex Subunit 3 [Manis pentadactyla]
MTCGQVCPPPRTRRAIGAIGVVSVRKALRCKGTSGNDDSNNSLLLQVHYARHCIHSLIAQDITVPTHRLEIMAIEAQGSRLLSLTRPALHQEYQSEK